MNSNSAAMSKEDFEDQSEGVASPCSSWSYEAVMGSTHSAMSNSAFGSASSGVHDEARRPTNTTRPKLPSHSHLNTRYHHTGTGIGPTASKSDSTDYFSPYFVRQGDEVAKDGVTIEQELDRMHQSDKPGFQGPNKCEPPTTKSQDCVEEHHQLSSQGRSDQTSGNQHHNLPIRSVRRAPKNDRHEDQYEGRANDEDERAKQKRQENQENQERKKKKTTTTTTTKN